MVIISRWTAMKTELLSRKGFLKKRMPSAEKQQEIITGRIGQIPNRKVADVGKVDPPKTVVKVLKKFYRKS
jgi:hypothetical protein